MDLALLRRAVSGEPQERITDIYIITMLLIFPLFTGFSGYSSITFSKYLFFVIATCLYIAALAVCCVLRRYRPKKLTPAQLCALAFMALCCISALLSEHRLDSLIGASRYDGLVTQLLYGCIFLCVSAFSRPKGLYFAAFGLSCSLCCVIAILQLFGLDPLWLFPGSYDYYDTGIHYTSRFLGTIGNVDVLISLFCIALPSFFVLTVTGTRPRTRLYLVPLVLCSLVFFAADVSGGLVALAACALIGAPFFLTDARLVRRSLLVLVPVFLCAAVALTFSGARTNGVLSFAFRFGKPSLVSAALAAGCAALAALLYVLKSFSPSAKQLRLFFSALSAAVFLAFLAAAYFWRGTEGSVYELSQILHGNPDDSFGSHRILIWRETLALVPEAPIFGGGPDTLVLRLDVEFSRFVEETGKTLRVFVDNAHNEYLGYLVNIGILGLASYIAVLLCCFISLIRNRRLHFTRCLLLALVCACVQSFFGIGLCLTAPVLWIYLGIAAGSTADQTGG